MEGDTASLEPKASDESGHIDTTENFTRRWRVERPDIDVRTVAVIANIYLVGQAIEAEFRTYSQREFGLGTGDMRILLALRRSASLPPLRATDLFQSLLVSSGAVTKQIDRLERQRLVRRDPDPNQKKQRLISLTREGKAIADKAIEAIATEFAVSKAVASFPAADIERFLVMIDRMQRP